MFENGSVSTDFESEKSLLGVLVAISIPIFTSQLEKSKEATDQANLRAAYAAVMAAGLSEDDATTIAKQDTDKIKYTSSGSGSTYTCTATVTLVQSDLSKWESDDISVGGITLDKPAATVTITYKASDGTVTISIAKTT